MENSTTLQSEKSLEEMLNDCSIDAIMAFDVNKNLIAWNTIAEKVHRKKKYEVMGKPVLEVIPSIKEDEETLQAIKLAMKGLKSFVPASKKYHHRRHAENHFIPLIDGDSVIGVMNLVHDVAHRIKAEEELQQLNEELERRYRQLKVTSDELASFTYITSNKIKEPIRHLYTGIEHLIKLEAKNLSDSGRAAFRRIQSSINRMDLLLDDILSLAQISILQETDTMVDLDELVREAADAVIKKSEKNAGIICDKLGLIHGHKQYLFRLFYNLIDNAVKFNKSEKPVVKIACENIILNDKENEFLNGREYYKVMVCDNGIGFNTDVEKERIFKMFEKLHDKEYKGSGMGLTIVQKIMHAHGGFIQAESTEGNGSVFNCFFPVNNTVTV